MDSLHAVPHIRAAFVFARRDFSSDLLNHPVVFTFAVIHWFLSMPLLTRFPSLPSRLIFRTDWTFLLKPLQGGCRESLLFTTALTMRRNWEHGDEPQLLLVGLFRAPSQRAGFAPSFHAMLCR